MLGGNEKVGPTPSNNHITCSESKVAHQRISFHQSFGNNVKVKVMEHLCMIIPVFRPYEAFSAALISAGKKVQRCLYATVASHLMCFPNTDPGISSESNGK